MNSYRIVIVAPEQNAHVAVFTELAIALVTAIRENGFACDLKLNDVSPHATNIILGFHLLTNPIPKEIRYIVYQLEQLSETEGIFSRRPEMISIMNTAHAVWDYSTENICFLKQKGVQASLIPVGYSPLLVQIPKSPKDIDILFYGSRNERRGKVLQELLNRGYKVKALFGLYGEERDQWIARSKLVLNIHFYEANLFESVRVSFLLNNGIPVLSESSPSYPWDSVPLEMVHYDNLVEKAVEMLGDPKLSEYGRTCQKQLAQDYSMAQLIQPLLS